MAEKYYSLTTYDFVGGNPISRIDPNGESWFFDHDGNYLGEDPEGVEVRIMSFEDWKQYMLSYEDLLNASTLLSSNNLLNAAMVKIFQYFYKGSFSVSAGHANNKTLAWAEVGIDTKQFNTTTMKGATFLSGEIVLNMTNIKGNTLFDNGYNIMNLLVHEDYHIADAIYNPDRAHVDHKQKTGMDELRAIDAQKSHESWEKTSEAWKKGIYNYQEENQSKLGSSHLNRRYPKKSHPWLY